MPEYLLGVDVGTTALKIVLFTTEGQVVKKASREYKLETPRAHWVECDSEVYWSSFKICLTELLSQGIAPSEIKALGISSQGESLVVVDKVGQTLRKAIVWLDDRAIEEAQSIKENFPLSKVYHTTGQPDVLPTWPACKILWLKKNEPEVFRKAHKYLLLEDYFIFRLSGKVVSDYSLYCSSLMLDINRKIWWKEMLDFIGLSAENLPELVESGTAVGNVINEQTGLAKETKVVTGGMDQVCGMVGVGNIAPGIISESTGGALAICATMGKPLFEPSQRIPCHYHARQDAYFLLPWCQTGGMTLRWLRDLLGYSSYEQMTKEAAKIPAGSEGLVILPHLAGAGSPEFNPKARGVLFGLALATSRAHLIRATLESIGYLIKENIEVLEELEIKVEEIRSLGGGVRSVLWSQIKADITERPIVTMQVEEAACMGAAILAGVGIDLFPSLEGACNQMNREKNKYLPEAKHFPLYRQAYQKYLRISKLLLPLF